MIKNIIIIALLLSLSLGGFLANNAIGILKSTITTLQIKHKKAIVKTKVKERGKRVLAAIPIAGLIALAWFEKLEYDEWKMDHPEGSPEQYSNEMADLIHEVADEYYAEIQGQIDSESPASTADGSTLE
ncbi:MAG: hypothetical protein ACKE9I_07940 [Methylophagaceae bacterium]